jgi:O-antigen/teichoic acid export membrane protein
VKRRERPHYEVLRTPAAGGLVIRGGTLRAGGYAVGLLLGIVTSVLLLRGLGVVDAGRYLVVAALLGIVSAVTDAGLTAVGARDLALRPPGRERDELLRTLQGLRVLLTCAGVGIAALFAFVVGYDGVMVAGTLLAGIGVLLVNTQATAMMPLSIELRLGAITAVEVFRHALTLASVAALTLAGASLLPYFLVQVLVGVGALAVTPLVMRSARTLRPGLEHEAARRLLREALPLAVAIAMNVLYLRLLVIVVSLTEDEKTIGLYTTSFRVFEMLIGIPITLLSVALPLLAVAGADDRERLRYGLQRMTEVALVLAVGLALVVMAAAGPGIRFLYRGEFSGADRILHLQAWALVPLFVGQVLALGLISLRRQQAVAWANAGALVTVVVLGIVLTEVYGARGAAAAGIAAEAVLLVLLGLALTRGDRDLLPRVPEPRAR